jgi:hypothetical protein
MVMNLKFLMPGVENAETVDLLLSLTKINSEEIQDAIRDHLVRGRDMAGAALLNDVPKQNLSRALVKLNEVAEIVQKIINIKRG